jgi:hypothetical protein
MNMNQIVNMVLRIVMRKAINSGIKSGMKAVSGKGQKKPRHVAENTANTAPRTQQAPQTENGGQPTQAQIRERRRARKEIRLARQQQRPSNGSS